MFDLPSYAVRYALLAAVTFSLGPPSLVAGKTQQKLSAPDPADAVNVMIGTAAEGQTFPATGVPFAMTQWTPQTRAGEPKCITPFYIADTLIQGFRGSHFLSGSCAQDYGSFTLMPLLNPTHLDSTARATGFSRQTEVAHPYLYRVDLDTGIRAEITGSARAGMMRFRFPAAQSVGWLDLENNVRLGTGSVHIDERRQEITGRNPVFRIYSGNGQPAGFSGYVVVQFDRPFTTGGTWLGEARHEGATEQAAQSEASGAYVRFALGQDPSVRVRIGTSFVSVDEARKNLAELPDWDFDAAVARAHEAWNEALGAVDIHGHPADRPIFYTALYHAMLLPRAFSDRSGTYPEFGGGGKVETAKGFTYYCDYSVWDTFRGVHPLMTLLQPQRDGDMVQSLVMKGEQGGFLPIFPAWNSYTSEMTGDYATAIITDAYIKGIHNFDAAAAYRLMRKNATGEPPTPEAYQDGRGRRALDSYLKYGYIPLEDHVPFAFHKDEQVSRTLDYAFADHEVSVMAEALGHTQDAALFAHRAQNWKNVIDPSVGFARGRHADGNWVTPFDPAKAASFVTESTPYVYTFFVLHDVPGLIATLGGPAAFEQKLDGLFAQGLYDHGNEPSHHIAYLYDDAGAPAKTQLHVHDIMGRLYRNEPAGLTGNDDAGQMSAWYVLSALGFYPVNPGSPRYNLGTPRFDDVTLHTGNGRSLHILAAGAESGRFYVRSVRLNGTLLHRTHLLHSEITGGGTLVFEMSATPGGAHDL